MYLPEQFHQTDLAIAQSIMRELPTNCTVAMLNGMGAFEMQITDLQCAVKFNQPRPEAHAAVHATYAQGTEQTITLDRRMKDVGLVP